MGPNTDTGGITLSGTLAVGRQRAFRMDPNGHAQGYFEIRPREPRSEYITLVLGTVPKGQRVTMEDVVDAMTAKLAQFKALLAEAAADETAADR